jgi:hypothetical protein
MTSTKKYVARMSVSEGVMRAAGAKSTDYSSLVRRKCNKEALFIAISMPVVIA